MTDSSVFPGYRPFQPNEAGVFAGRGAETRELLGRLLQNRLLAVVGQPEIGKSSLVRTGLIPALPDDWRWALMRPGENPTANLVSALEGPSALGHGLGVDGPALLSAGPAAITRHLRGPLLVVVDPFDELFRYRDSRQRLDTASADAAFVDLLIALANDPQAPVHVLVTMRSSFVERCADFRGLTGALQRFNLAPMGREQLRDAIAEPLRQAAGGVSANLLDALVNAYEAERFPGHLPIIQHALRRAWDRRRARRKIGELTVEDWEEIGREPDDSGGAAAAPWLRATPSAALLRHAREVYEECDTGDRLLVRRLFRTLVAKVEGTFMRRPCTVCRIAELWQVDPLVVARVVERFQAPGQTVSFPSQ